MGFLSHKSAPPAPPPPPPTPPTYADSSVRASGSAARFAAAATSGAGFADTIKNVGGEAGAPTPSTAQKQLLGGST